MEKSNTVVFLPRNNGFEYLYKYQIGNVILSNLFLRNKFYRRDKAIELGAKVGFVFKKWNNENK